MRSPMESVCPATSMASGLPPAIAGIGVSAMEVE